MGSVINDRDTIQADLWVLGPTLNELLWAEDVREESGLYLTFRERLKSK